MSETAEKSGSVIRGATHFGLFDSGLVDGAIEIFELCAFQICFNHKKYQRDKKLWRLKAANFFHLLSGNGLYTWLTAD